MSKKRIEACGPYILESVPIYEYWITTESINNVKTNMVGEKLSITF